MARQSTLAMIKDDTLSIEDTDTLLDSTFRGVSNTEIATALGVSRNTVSNWRKNGMPVNQARYVLARGLLELERKKAAVLRFADIYGI